jgi:hypothetical protein
VLKEFEDSLARCTSIYVEDELQKTVPNLVSSGGRGIHALSWGGLRCRVWHSFASGGKCVRLCHHLVIITMPSFWFLLRPALPHPQAAHLTSPVPHHLLFVQLLSVQRSGGHLARNCPSQAGAGACQLIGSLILWFVGICTPRHFDWPR